MDLFKRILQKIKRYILYKVFKFVTKQKGNKFEKLFNLYSKFDNFVKIKVQFSDPNYFILDDNIKYKFFPLERIRFYLQGLNTRFEILKKEYLLDNIKFYKDDVVIDCGANNGDFYFCFNDKIRYYGFEPSPTIFKNLKYNVNNQNLYQLGLWKNSAKKIKFYINDVEGDSSIIPINNYSSIENINTITLDEIISKIDKNIKLIKIEAEGAEPEILEGLKENLLKVEYLTIDCGFERGINQESTISKCTNYLLKNNFKMICFSKFRNIALFKNDNLKL
tara:strand:- start:525 stop:1358 length:834 start_codon:yes stop_codon:yes gene_type:complete